MIPDILNANEITCEILNVFTSDIPIIPVSWRIE